MASTAKREIVLDTEALEIDDAGEEVVGQEKEEMEEDEACEMLGDGSSSSFSSSSRSALSC